VPGATTIRMISWATAPLEYQEDYFRLWILIPRPHCSRLDPIALVRVDSSNYRHTIHKWMNNKLTILGNGQLVILDA
jgi:hypothetical protein